MPGSARRRLLDAAMLAFERDGYDAAGVIDIAGAAGVTTGSLYHHFGSKLELFQVIRREMERRVRDRIEGAAAAAGGGRQGLATALLVGFDAAATFKALRILSECPSGAEDDTLVRSLEGLVAPAHRSAARILLGAWRSALAAAADSLADSQGASSVADVRRGLAWALGAPERSGAS